MENIAANDRYRALQKGRFDRDFVISYVYEHGDVSYKPIGEDGRPELIPLRTTKRTIEEAIKTGNIERMN